MRQEEAVAEGDGQTKRESGFKGHKRRGRRHLPLMRTLPTDVALHEFRKVALPDFLWLLAMLRERPLAEGAGPTGLALDLAQAAFDRAHARGAFDDPQESVFHGLLTDWQRVPELERRELLEEFREMGLYDAVAPEAFTQALAAYPDAPGRWLIEPRLLAGLAFSLPEAEKHLAKTVRLAGRSNQPLATHAIFLWFRGLVIKRRISFPGDPVFVDILPRYPDDVNDTEREIAESTLRAMFLAVFHGQETRSATLDWCQRFWRANRDLYECLRQQPETPAPTDLEKLEIWTARCKRLQCRFLLASREIDPDLWGPDRYDVLTGMTWRVLRIAGHLIAHPSQWSEEHGYPAVRSMFEAFVQMRWMLKVEESRAAVWHEFKDHGRGRAKALKLHTEAVIEKTTGEPSKLLEGVLSKLKEEVNRDISEDFQVISTASTFIDGKSLFDMAQEVGLGDMYQLTMGPASSALHGDWSALDDLYLDRCVHPLHGPHVLPKLEPADESDERLPFMADSFSRLAFQAYCEAMGYQAPKNEFTSPARGEPEGDRAERDATE
jgi:hypothetical protein